MNNQPAFPSGNDVRLGDWKSHGHSGMTLRDYFAARAMQGLIASPRGLLGKNEITDVDYAQAAYLIADAMMKAREA